MRNLLKTSNGLTLIELLVSITLLSMVLFIITSIHLFSINQSNHQTTHIEHQSNVRLVLNTVTKEIRKAQEIVLLEEGNDDKFHKIEMNEVSYEFYESTNTIKKNEINFVEDIGNFWVKEHNDGKLEIFVESTQLTNGKKTQFSTEIYTRK
ncbi:PilW family protein [Salipaludibacillus sp. HK11]|uniref:PilW family protein n=1 Tax=Salipaludibacillus sp. HK11 TaxID=3394320 RepID=UPI0039FDCB34